jgi:hypothetical protein
VQFDRWRGCIDRIRQGRTWPERISLDIEHDVHDDEGVEWVTFDSAERCIYFLNALRGNSHVERLDLSGIHVPDGIPQALVAGLLENGGLIHLSLGRRGLDGLCWGKLKEAISTHKYLRTLAFEEIHDEDGRELDFRARQGRTSALADMLLMHQQVDEIPFDRYTSDQDLWNTLVLPRLESLLCAKWFAALSMIGESSRPTVVASALARVAKKPPSLVWMLLSQNLDLLFS